MPTKKKRVGFIPRNDVLEIINKLSFENNLSYSKIINILVEEALQNRGIFNSEIDKSVMKKEVSTILNTQDVLRNNHYNDHLNNQKFRAKNLDLEIYQKFLMFLQFEEEMKKKNI